MIQKVGDSAPDACRKCGKGPVQRLFSSPAIQFKGTGWYITDYAKGNSGASAAGGVKADGESKAGESKASDSSTSDSKASETKPAKTDAASSSPAPTSTPAAKP